MWVPGVAGAQPMSPGYPSDQIVGVAEDSTDRGLGCVWDQRFPAQGPDEPLLTFAVWNDGNGSALYAGGEFTRLGAQSISYLARWDGTTWSPLASGPNGFVRAMTVWDDGGGEALYVAGDFTQVDGNPAARIAKWDGTSWSTLGTGASTNVWALTTWDDGGGEALYAAGRFLTAGGVTVNRVAKWDGTSWSALGTGINSTVTSLTVFDDGGGSALYAAGYFVTAGGVTVNRVAKWDGTSWSALGTGMDSGVLDLQVWDDGGGDDLYAGGVFNETDGSSIPYLARWDGTAWTAVGSPGLNGSVAALTVFDDGSGASLHAGGDFTFADGQLVWRTAKFDGTDWSPLGSGTNGRVQALESYDDGSGAALFVGGIFTQVGTQGIGYLARWQGAQWSPVLAASGGLGLNDEALAFTLFDDGSGPDLIVGGAFTAAGDVDAARVARWDGTSWSAMGSGLPFSVTSLAVYNDGTGPTLYATDRRLLKWNGSSWEVVQDLIGLPYAMAVHDDGTGPALYVGGKLIDTSDKLVDLYVGRWDGSTWSLIYYSPQISGDEPDDRIYSMLSWAGAEGEELLAAGSFPSDEDLIEYQGLFWQPYSPVLDAGYKKEIRALETVGLGDAPALFVGGSFTVVEGGPTDYLAQLDNGAWSTVGSGVNGAVTALGGAFNEGQGLGLVAGGAFTQAGGIAASHIGGWNGTSWQSLGLGLDEGPSVMKAFDDGSGASLYVGGPFATAGGSFSNAFARWVCPSPDFGVDAAVSLDNGVDSLVPGLSTTYTLSIANTGWVDIPSATLTDTLPPELSCSWTVIGSGSASGYLPGPETLSSETSGDALRRNTSGSTLGHTLVLPVGSSVTYSLDCVVDPEASGDLTLTVGLSAALDVDLADNTASDTDTVLSHLFADGFESGNCTAWSTCPK